jgi:predicted 2-oxoglutarate/Fe(II)-dependent dioxygenase YbiX
MDCSAPFADMPPPLSWGEPVPWFTAPVPGKPRFLLDAAAGRWVLLGFLPPPGPGRDAALAELRRVRDRFDDANAACFLVVRDAATVAAAQNEIPGLRWYLDSDGEVSRLYGASDTQAFWLLLDPTLRVAARAPADDAAALFAEVAALPAPAAYAGVPLVAPVLIVPRVFEAALCRRLIAHHQATGGERSGVMREVGGRTVPVLDDFKSRRDARVEDPAFRAELRARIVRRLLPEIEKVFQFRATRIERYLVACYDATEGGYFLPHRDDTTKATAHRRFAVSINLNAEEFEGGDLRFPEFGRATYRPPTGGAMVFACGMQHEATPVTQGRRYAFLPFLFDEAAEAVRQANVGFLDLGAAEPEA